MFLWSGSFRDPRCLLFRSLLGVKRKADMGWLSVAIFGLLGLTISATLAISKTSGPSRIPEMVSSAGMTTLRLLMGPASAILLYFFAQSDLCKMIIKFGQIGRNV